MQEITNKIRQEARALLAEGRIDVIVGYQQGWDEEIATPCFVTDETEVDTLIYDESCTHNLAKYLAGREGYLTSRFRARDEKPRVALVATPAAFAYLRTTRQMFVRSSGRPVRDRNTAEVCRSPRNRGRRISRYSATASQA